MGCQGPEGCFAGRNREGEGQFDDDEGVSVSFYFSNCLWRIAR